MMKTKYKVAVWALVAVAVAIITHTNPLWWLVGVLAAKLIARLVLTIAVGVVLYILFYALIFAGLFWILIS
ncbi:hypothetical protein BN938_0689 [Mucinivorans hirudinis]|uniref:Uncharacterized protein n=1 Tax=Mucinivorans hirudinis TaxID=1433126 RepID=A0A060RBN3_9BACT|nr:hypothetical protein BN938_0689 [Mucinivorans hirudinis]